MLIELLDLLIGIVFGFFHKGKEDYTSILRNGAIIGIVIGIIFVLVTIFLAPGSMSISLAFLGTVGFIIEILIFVVIFIAGAFIGDRIERVIRK
jgi:Na+/proline symporter